jgi:asparagine synthase (glutamine-hydrolysing)
MSMIFGCVRRDGGNSFERLRELVAPFHGRHPEGMSTWVGQPAALAIARLITLPGPQDPGLASIAGEDVIVALDGRIDNAESLRKELDLPRGVGSSEIVARGYAMWAETLFDRLIGEFAILIWDRRRAALFAVRDALGIRPLYYWQAAGAFAVASDVEAFLSCREFDRTPEDEVVVDYLVGRFRDSSKTFFQHASRIPAGHYLVIDLGGFHVRRYWYPPRRDGGLLTTIEYYDQFQHLFEQAVKRRLAANTPVLVHVSGGLDSTSIFSMAIRLPEADAVRGVAAVHPGLDCDESRYIADVSISAGVRIETWDGTRSEPLDLTNPSLVAPGARAVMSGGSIGDIEIGRREGARVILSGTGGDQLGTPTGVLHQMFVSRAWRQALHWSLGFPGMALPGRMRRLAYGLSGLAPAYARRLWAKRPRKLPPWLNERLRSQARRPAARAHDLTFLSAVERRHWEELTSAQLEVSVEYIQRQASENSVEVRFPFLDRDLVCFVLAIPFQHWPAPEGRQRLHRRALADILPQGTVDRMDKAEFSQAFAQRVRVAHSTIARMFRDGEWASGKYVERGRAFAMVEAAARPAANPAEAVSVWRLATTEAWLRRIFGYIGPSGELHAKARS